MGENPGGIDHREASEKAAKLRAEVAEKNLESENASAKKDKTGLEEVQEDVEVGRLAQEYLDKLKKDKAA